MVRSLQSAIFERHPLAATATVWLIIVIGAMWVGGNWGGLALAGQVGVIFPLLVKFLCLGIISLLVASGKPTGRRRTAWRILLAFSLLDVVGGVWWTVNHYVDGTVYGSGPDILYLFSYPLYAAACVALFRDQGGSFHRRRIWLDVATFTLGLGTGLSVLIFGSGSHAASGNAGQLVSTFGYTVGDTSMMVAAALLFMQVMSWKSERSTMLIVAVAVTTLLADTVYVVQSLDASYVSGSLSDVFDCLNNLLLASAAVLEFRREVPAEQQHSAEGNVYSFLPVFAVLMAIVMLFGSQVGTREVESTALLVVVLIGAGLIAARQMSVRHDVMALNKALAERHAEERLTELVRRSADLIVVVNDAGTLSYVSPAAQSVLGISDANLVDTPAVESPLPPADLDLDIGTPGGERHSVHVSGSDHRNSNAIAGLTLTIRDVTENKRLEEQLRSLAFYDPLTLLANRSLFADRAHHAVNRISAGFMPAVLFIDLDNFKTINDGLGHSMGDKLLCACAQRIVQGTRTSDTVARLGGDEFAVLIDHASSAEATLATANHILEALAAPLEIDDRALHITASIGICMANSQTTTERLLRDADAAMYRAKALGKGRAVIFEAEMAKAARRRLMIEQELSSALERKELFVHYQPIVDLKSGHLIGFEALMRWQHPTRGVVMPDEFIPVAEETGCIIPMTRWILRQACHDAASLRAGLPHGEGLRLSVNVSGRYLYHKDMVAEVREVLQESTLEPGSLLLEVTESLLLKESAELEQRLAELKGLGVRLALDDFGTGYSSLAYLHRFPLDVLKIDRSFIQQLTGPSDDKNRDAAALAKAILTLADALGLDTVAEGVEVEAQRDALLKLGCQTGQGYSFGKPMPLTRLMNTTAGRRRSMLVENITGPVEFTATGRFRLAQSRGPQSKQT
jgi:diguanylate cyclase (GGDEF)-like protein